MELNELINCGNITLLGNGTNNTTTTTSLNISSKVGNYKEMTKDNFLLELKSAVSSGANTNNSFSISKSYNASTGVLIYALTPKMNANSNWHATFTVYCVSY